MHTVQMAVFRARICCSALVWLEVGDWENTPRPVLPLGKHELARTCDRLLSVALEVTKKAKSAADHQLLSQMSIPVRLTESELCSIVRTLNAVAVELGNDPIEMRTAITNGADPKYVKETADLLQRFVAVDG